MRDPQALRCYRCCCFSGLLPTMVVVYVTHNDTSILGVAEEVFLERCDSKLRFEGRRGFAACKHSRQLRERKWHLGRHSALWEEKCASSSCVRQPTERPSHIRGHVRAHQEHHTSPSHLTGPSFLWVSQPLPLSCLAWFLFGCDWVLFLSS